MSVLAAIKLSDLRKEATPPQKWNVVFLNDDVTPIDFVIEVMVTIFAKDKYEAKALTRQIEKNGRGVVGTYTLDIAETKLSRTKQAALDGGFPLACNLERV